MEPDQIGAGLSNLGNTCFINAVLQCITHTVPLVEKLRSVNHPRCSAEDEEFCALCALRDHVERSIAMSGHIIVPEQFPSNLSKISSDFVLGSQGDSHEFLRCLLDSVDNCCLQPKSKEKPSLEEDSLVKQVFGGRLKSQLKCSECNHHSDTFEPLLDLSLEINNADSVTEALESFFRVEKIDDEETKFTCGGCNHQVTVEKQLTLDQAPEVVSLHLKRFENNGLCIEKITKPVKFELELDLKPFVSSTNAEGQFTYDLYAVVVHVGDGCMAHYYTFIRSSPSAWHWMNDSKVMGVSESLVLDEPAYLLFYKKQGSSPWFSSFMEAQKMLKCNSPDHTSPMSVFDFADRNPVPVWEGQFSGGSLNDPLDKNEDSILFTYSRRSSITVNSQTTVDPSQTLIEGKLISNANSGDESPTCLSRTRPPRRPRQDDSSVEIIFQDEPLDEGNACQIPQAHIGDKGLKEASTPANRALNNIAVDESFRRLVRGMPSARRAGLLSCLPQHQPQSGSYLMEGPRPLDRKRRKCFTA
ncbi:ubiquitin carboxyl-terminal hydrolase 21-like [Dioscorea cayenensis subsp. rotundata]|uniref:Ubiquitin carboxyl-terminal hydrolase 21-like n=1 Tax=Dioscorea cayennensis subsp. rotundata TaxID=55577 RepID=A0AB40CTP8_DIOCR|nr:ubiquitin carboxyl-terminal hydrolase 21-like [Dioscorea cayenensis subsp. rotundata]